MSPAMDYSPPEGSTAGHEETVAAIAGPVNPAGRPKPLGTHSQALGGRPPSERRRWPSVAWPCCPAKVEPTAAMQDVPTA